MVAGDQRRLYDQRTLEALRRRTDRTLAVVMGIAALFAAGLFLGGHTEIPMLAELAGYCAHTWGCDDYPFYLDWLAGGIGLLLFGLLGLLAIRFRRERLPTPTVFCEKCDGAGWVADLERWNGLCPRCRHDRFTYVGQPIGGGIEGPAPRRIVEPRMTGRDLVERRRAHPWDKWLYNRYF